MSERKRYFGVVRRDDDPEIVMMICTAGHVDHGKTRLVKLLTGCSTDRLKAEQERGLTIELGFAPCMLRGNLAIGIVDVPGHEKFVRNMVAGVSGIELSILVIAADDGIMPQTVEHFQIMRLLGVRYGMVALTKIDLVDKELRQRRVVEIREFLDESFMCDAPICPLSSETGEGFAEFYDTLIEQVSKIRKIEKVGIFRMPIERVFIRPGFGVVLTGIPVSGTVRVGDSVEVMPGNLRGKVRGIQCFLRDTSSGARGRCLALNIPDLDKGDIRRGQVLAAPGYLRHSKMFHLRIDAVHNLDRPIRNAEEIKFHTGTAEEPGKVYLLEGKTLDSGKSAFATVVLAHPIAAAEHDQFILRRSSPSITVGGGAIRQVSYESSRPRRQKILAFLQDREEPWNRCNPTTLEGVECLIELAMCSEYSNGGTLDDIATMVLLPVSLVGDGMRRLEARGVVFALRSDYFICTKTYNAHLRAVEEYIGNVSKNEKLLHFPLNQLRVEFELPDVIWERIQRDLARDNGVEIRGSTVILHDAVDALSDEDRRLMTMIIELYEDRRFNTPRPDELPELLGMSQVRTESMLRHLLETGRLVRVSPKVVIELRHLRAAQTLTIDTIERDGSLISGEFKEKIDSTRKYALAILEFFDKRHITTRNDNYRKLIPGYQKRLI